MALMATASPALAAPPRSRAAALLDAELAAIAAAPACALASLSVLAIRDGRVAYQGQFGQRFMGNAALPARPANPATLYRIASISKMMTALGAMMLVEAGKLVLDADVSTYLGFALRNPAFPDQPVTLRHLLSHTSGLRDAAGYSWPCAVALEQILPAGAALHGTGKMWSPTTPPGAFFTYANLGWGVLGTIMERVSGERFDRLMQRLLLDPLQMRGGYYPPAFTQIDLDNLATLYRKRSTDTEVWNPAGPWIAQADDTSPHPPAAPAGIDQYVIGSNATPFSPTGGLRVSAADMGKVMLMMMHDGRHAGRQVLQPATLALMRTPHWRADAAGDQAGNGDTAGGLFHAWGLGLQLFGDRPGQRLVEGGGFAGVGHLGDAYGLRSVFAADLARRDGMIVLIGGLGSDPAAYKARDSSMARFEEHILSALYRHAIRA